MGDNSWLKWWNNSNNKSKISTTFIDWNGSCKVVIFKFVFCWLLFRVKFDCNFIQSYIPCICCGNLLQGLCDSERECKDLSYWSKEDFRGYLVTKRPAKRCLCLAHDWNAKSQYRWRQLCLASISRVRPSRETFCSVKLYYLIHTFCTYTIYTHITHKWEGEDRKSVV